jgi:hypothetical protein
MPGVLDAVALIGGVVTPTAEVAAGGAAAAGAEGALAVLGPIGIAVDAILLIAELVKASSGPKNPWDYSPNDPRAMDFTSWMQQTYGIQKYVPGVSIPSAPQPPVQVQATSYEPTSWPEPLINNAAGQEEPLIPLNGSQQLPSLPQFLDLNFYQSEIKEAQKFFGENTSAIPWWTSTTYQTPHEWTPTYPWPDVSNAWLGFDPYSTNTTPLPAGFPYSGIITHAAMEYGLAPVLLAAVGENETMMGLHLDSFRRGKWDKHGNGIWQLDDQNRPGQTPRPQWQIDLARRYPGFAAKFAAKELSTWLHREGGDVKAALHDYNAGPSPRAKTTPHTWDDNKGHREQKSYEESVWRFYIYVKNGIAH